MQIRVWGLALGLLCLAGSSPLLADEKSMPEASSTSAAAAGSETVCKNGSMVRRVKVGSDEGQGSCKVSYVKETEEPSAGEKVLWNAQQQSNYCQEKAQGFVEKLKGLGWACE